MAHDRTQRYLPILVSVFVLSYLGVAVFFPILGFPFIELDVLDQVVANPHIRGLTSENLKHILTSRCVTSYYPVRTLTFALDHQIWGLNPSGFKLTGGLIHLANVLLVFWLIIRLSRCGAETEGLAERGRVADVWEVALAAFSAGIFAVHPVVVEPVTWVGGREELLMTLGALGCFHFHLSARRLSREGGNTARAMVCFVGGAFCCAAACLSSAVGAVIPLLITAWDILTLPRPKLRRVVRGTFALWLIGAAVLVIKRFDPDPSQGALRWTISAEQPTIILTAYGLNLKTLVWPTKLAILYAWITPENLSFAEVVPGGLAVAATCVLLWQLRRRTWILFGLLWFCLALGPTSQIIPHHVHRADRFLYLPLVGLAIAVAMALKPLRRFVEGRLAMMACIAVGVGVLCLLQTLSTRQVRTWRDDLTLWKHCVAVAPNCTTAHSFLGNHLVHAGQMDRAMASYRKSLELEPNNTAALLNFAVCLTSGSDPRLHDYALAVQLARRGCELTKRRDPRFTRTLANAYTASAGTLAADGRYGAAIDHYEKAIEVHPEFERAFFNLSILLSTCGDEGLRTPKEAVRLAERGCELTARPNAHQLGVLATAYAEAGRFDDATVAAQRAIDAARISGDANLAYAAEQLLRLFQNRVPVTKTL